MNTTKKCAPLLAAALCLALGCGKGDDTKKRSGPAPGPETKNGEPPTPPAGTSEKPDFVLTSKELGEEHKKDEKAAEAKYKNKTIELTGEVNNVGTNISGDAYLALQGGEGQLLGVMCFTKDKTPWKKVAPGQTVKLRGKWPKFSVGAALADCRIIEVSGPAPPALTADQLAKEYAADADAASKKYDNKYLVLTGEIAKVEFNDAEAASITLKTETMKPRVLCTFTAFDKDKTKQLKVGQKIKVLGQYTLNLDPEEVALHFCILME